LRRIALSAVLASIAACVAPATTFDRLARDAGLVRGEVAGNGYVHVVYERGLENRQPAELHIYLHGDGTPRSGGRPSRDPTPRKPVTLDMMRLDQSPAVLIGRPCYFGRAVAPECQSRDWTEGRYSPAIIASLRAVVAQYVERYEPRRVVLVGYSGGGGLAALLAPAIERPVFLVTVAGNLDTDLWARLRGFHPLAASVNPLDRRDAVRALPQLHLYGLADEIVPPAVVESYVGEDRTQLRPYPELDHTCCWQQVWSNVLANPPWRP
jgi:pimeloyl-ACP methyl ester carboxylesterase